MQKTNSRACLIGMMLVMFFMVAADNVKAQLLINEVILDAPNPANEACNYVELRGVAGSTVPANVKFLSIDGDSGNFGFISTPVELGGLTVGSNGTITLINDVELCAGRTFPAGTTQKFYTSFINLGQGAETYAVVSSPNQFFEGDTIDANSDRVIDPAAQVTIIDGFGVTVNQLFQATYAPNIYDAATLGKGSIDLPDAAVRFPNNNQQLSAVAFYYGEMASTPDNTTAFSGTPVSPNFPTGGILTPGAPNLPTTAAPAKAVVDFDGDGRTDYSVARNQTGQLVWYNSINGTGTSRIFQWGNQNDVAVPEDFDGDGKDDFAVWRAGNPNQAAFYIFQSATNTARVELFGQTGDNPGLVGDWDGDNRADVAVYRDGAQGVFYYRGSLNNPSGNTTFLPWGTTGDKPQVGDFDGDGRQDAAVFRSSNALWYIRQSSNQQPRYDDWGIGTDKFVPANYDGDARTDLAVFRDGTWYIKQSSNAEFRIQRWGSAGDLAVPGDYNGDGRADFAVWRQGVFYIQPTANSVFPTYFRWGATGDSPVANVFTE